MFVINETESGEDTVCILSFSARPRDDQNQPISAVRRTFHVGERVRYCGYFFKDTPEDNPTGYMAIFQPLDADDQRSYAATADYFVTMDCWNGLKHYLEETGDKQPSKKAANRAYPGRSAALRMLPGVTPPRRAKLKQLPYGPERPEAKPSAREPEIVDPTAIPAGGISKKMARPAARKRTSKSK